MSCTAETAASCKHCLALLCGRSEAYSAEAAAGIHVYGEQVCVDGYGKGAVPRHVAEEKEGGLVQR